MSDAKRIEHFTRLFHTLPADIDNMRELIGLWVVEGVADGRPLLNVLTQYDIDPEGVIDASLAELRDLAPCADEVIAASEKHFGVAMPANVQESFRTLATFFRDLTYKPRVREALHLLWRTAKLHRD